MAFLHNKDIEDAILRYRDTGTVGPELTRLLQQLIGTVLNKPNFRGYTPEWKQDMTTYAWIKLLRAIDIFKFGRGSKAYSYLTATIYNAFRTVLKEEYKQQNIKNKLQSEAVATMEYAFPLIADQEKRYLYDDYVD